MRNRLWAIFLLTVLALTWLVPGATRAAAAEAEPGGLQQVVIQGSAWLRSSQQPDGHWGTLQRLAVRDTAAAMEALRSTGDTGTPLQRAAAWLQAVPAGDHDSLARSLAALTSPAGLAERLVQGQNPDGGWGLAPGYASDSLDTALSLRALTTAGAQFQGAAQGGAAFLATRQAPDGSWGTQPHEPGNVYITAHVLIALGAARRSGAQVEASVLRNGAAWLLAHQAADGSWGAPANAMLTAAAYRGVLQGVAVSRIGPAAGWLVRAQAADGSWNGQAYTTAEAVQALALAAQIPDTRLGTARLLALGPGGPTPATAFRAYDSVLLEAAPPSAGLVLEAAVEGLPDGAFQPGDDGTLSWNTGATPPGDYRVAVLLKQSATGIVLDELTLPFTVESTLGLRSLSVLVSPDRVRVGEAASPQVVAQVENGSNVSGSVLLTARVSDADGALVQEGSQSVVLTPGESPTLPPLLSFAPDTAAPREYQVTVTASTGTQAGTLFRVLPPPAPVRIEPSKSVSPQQVQPGEADVAINVTLEGKGSAEQPGRPPIDLVLTIDNSGSMAWGDIPWVNVHPSRSDVAREASKALVDLLGPTDRGALVTFSYTFWTFLRQGLTSDKTLLKNRIDQYVAPWGATAIGAGLQKAREHLQTYSPAANKRVIILLSDGEETEWTPAQVQAQAALAAQQGILIYTIGLGATADRDLLQALATATGGKFYFSPSIQDLQAIMDELGRSLLQNAGKDVRVVDTIPAAGTEVLTDSISPTPYSVTQSGGNWVVEWRFTEIPIGQTRPISLSLHLTGLEPNEVREVNHRLVLTYVDAQSQTVTEELGPYTVSVAGAEVVGTLTLDKAEYGSDEPVLITAALQNTGTAAHAPEAVIEILDGAGNLVKSVLTQTVSLPGGASQVLDAQWNTGTNFAGPYFARLRLREAGRDQGSDQKPFAIKPDGGATLETGTDKQMYNPGERVAIASRVTAQSRNAALTGLTVRTTVTDPGGAPVLTLEQPVPELVPGALADLTAAWAETAAAPAGEYAVHAVLLQGQTQLAERSASFRIAASGETGAGLSGSVRVTPRQSLPSGDAAFTYTITNHGNGPVSGTLHLVIADTAAGMELATLQTPLDLAAGASAEGRFDYRFDDLPQGPLLASFGAVLPNGTQVPLGSTGFTTVRPFELTAGVETGLRRVLIWSAPGDELQQVTASLEAQGVWYTAVADPVSFRRELRSGAYGGVILADGRGYETVMAEAAAGGLDHLDWELRESVYSGTGLIVLGHVGLPQLEDEQRGHGSWLGTKAEALPEAGYSATFGDGRILWTDSTPLTLDQVLRQAVPTVVSPLGDGRTSGTVAVRLQVTGGPLPVSARVQVNLPAGVVVDAAPGAETTEPVLTYRFDLNPGEVKAYTFLARLPDHPGNQRIELQGAYLAHDRYHPDAVAAVSVGGLAVAPGLIEAVRTALPPATDNAGDNHIRNLTHTLDDLLQRPPQTAAELDQAIHRLLQDVNELDRLQGDTGPARKAYARLLGHYQARWATGR